jgi:hypothetical protein
VALDLFGAFGSRAERQAREENPKQHGRVQGRSLVDRVTACQLHKARESIIQGLEMAFLADQQLAPLKKARVP